MNVFMLFLLFVDVLMNVFILSVLFVGVLMNVFMLKDIHEHSYKQHK
jgi:predicted membrane protein